jgi:hypothetical protein
LDTSRLSRGEQILGASGVVLFLSSFLEIWASADVPGLGSVEANAWDAYGFLLKLGLILALVAVALVVARLLGANFQLPASLGLIYTGLGALTTFLILLTVLVGPDDEGADIIGVDVDRGFMLFVGLILAAVMTYGGYLHMQEEGTVPTPTEPPPPPAV